jgi:hypothetical protein
MRSATERQLAARQAAARPAARIAASSATVGRRVGAFCFKLFLYAQFFSMSRQFFFDLFSPDLAPYATAAGVGSLVLLLPAILGYGSLAGSPFGRLRGGARVWVALLAALVLFLLLLGWLWQGYYINDVLRESGAFLTVIACIILGSIPEFWHDVDRTLVTLLVAGMVVIALGFSGFAELLNTYGYQTRVAGETVAYDVQAVMHLLPYLLLTARWRSKWQIVIIMLGLLFNLGMQVLFQKRLDTFEALVYLLLFFFVLPRLASRWPEYRQAVPERTFKIAFAAIFVLGVGGALLLAPQIVRGQASALLARYGEEDTSRLQEAGEMLRDLEGWEYLIGRGMGGYFTGWSEAGSRRWGDWLADVGVVGKRSVHVGALMPMLKGGLLLSLVYYAGLAAVLLGWRRGFGDPLSAVAYLIVLVLSIHSLQGGLFLMESSYNLVLLGACSGWCLADAGARQGATNIFAAFRAAPDDGRPGAAAS